MDDENIKFYTLIHHHCSCRDDFDQLTNIARDYREFITRVKNGEKSVDVLNSLKIMKMCCRFKFLSVSYVPMIDRSTNRYYDDTENLVTKNTRELKFKKSPPDFPIFPV
tara:strand:+ start:175 stop:501 length:327 start_codon:yes stop_codon:yes gene_type:complete